MAPPKSDNDTKHFLKRYGPQKNNNRYWQLLRCKGFWRELIWLFYYSWIFTCIVIYIYTLAMHSRLCGLSQQQILSVGACFVNISHQEIIIKCYWNTVFVPWSLIKRANGPWPNILFVGVPWACPFKIVGLTSPALQMYLSKDRIVAIFITGYWVCQWGPY